VSRPRPPSYYEIAGINLAEEMDRLRALPCFEGEELARRRPELRIRRASRRPNRVGFAIPSEYRISVTAYPRIRPGDALETLLHELVHLVVGREQSRHAWHGPLFGERLRVAMRDGFGVTGVRAPASIHGAYADAIEKRRTSREQLAEGQLQLRLAA
jgi:hypothetical protein